MVAGGGRPACGTVVARRRLQRHVGAGHDGSVHEATTHPNRADCIDDGPTHAWSESGYIVSKGGDVQSTSKGFTYVTLCSCSRCSWEHITETGGRHESK